MTRIIELHTMDEAPMFALSVAWIEGTDPETGVSFAMTSGAGVGSPHLILTVDLPDGTHVREAVDIRDGLTEWVKAIIAERVP